MKNKIYPLLFGVLLTAQLARAQKCGTPTPPTPFWPQGKTHDPSAALADETYLIQIFVHILRDFDGSNAAINDADLHAKLQTMANYFQPQNICFVLIGQDFIDHTGWNRYYDIDMIDDLKAVNPHPNAIDIYIHQTYFTDGDDTLAGYAYHIPAGKMSVVGNLSEVYEHEMGHCLGLYHTFETAFGTECASEANCGWSGDLLCDTPADIEGLPVTGCALAAPLSLPCYFMYPPDGIPYPYHPLINNIMSYYEYTPCGGAFTPEQGDRMRDCIDDTDYLEDCLAPENFLATGTLGGEVGYAAKNTIVGGNFGGAGNLKLTAGAHGVFSAGSLVRLLPGTFIAPAGSNAVVLKINDLCGGGGSIAGDQSDNRDKPAAEPAGVWSVFPNPFSGSTTVAYTLAESSRVGIRVFGVTGRLVATLLEPGVQEAGEYRYEFDANGLPAGVYFLDIQKDGERATKRLILTKN